MEAAIRPWTEIRRDLDREIEDLLDLLKIERDSNEVRRIQARIAALEWVIERSVRAPSSDTAEPTSHGY